jgi:hypothetical protein
MIKCEQCGKKVKEGKHFLGYKKKLCSTECFKEAGKTYVPDRTTRSNSFQSM